MLKACKYCGRIHTHSEVCQHKPQSGYIRDKEIQRFRNSKAWRCMGQLTYNPKNQEPEVFSDSFLLYIVYVGKVC